MGWHTCKFHSLVSYRSKRILPMVGSVFKEDFLKNTATSVCKKKKKERRKRIQIFQKCIIKLNMHIPKREAHTYKLYLAYTNIIQVMYKFKKNKIQISKNNKGKLY